MNFSRVKLVMILCLAAANVFIGFFLMELYSERYYVSEEEAVLAERHLESIGINARLDRAQRRKYFLPVYNCDGISIDKGEIPRLYRDASEVFFGRNILESQYVDIPDGFSVSIKNSDGNAVGSSAFKRDLHFECILDEYTDTAIIDRMSKSFYAGRITYTENKVAEDIAKSFVGNAFSKSNLAIKKLGASEYDDGHIVYFGVFLSDTPIVDMYINVFVKDKRVACLYANIIDSTPVGAYSSNMFDSVNALYTFSSLYGKAYPDSDGNETVSVSDIGVMYKMTKKDSGGYYFIPAWKVMYSDGTGNDKIALFDAIVGENSYSIG